MSFKIELVGQEAQPVLFIRTRTAIEHLPQLIGASYGKIMRYLEELGEQPANAPYTAYYNLDMQDLDVEIGFPVAKSLPGKDDIESGEIPRGKYVSTMYKGPYSQMQEPYNEITKWMEAGAHEPTGVCYEYYLNAPGEVPESELLTRIAIPVK